MRARGARATTGARETREQIEARARDVREQGQDARACSANKLSKSGFGELICDLESLFARAESLFARARVGRVRARILALLAHLARARASICSRVSRARLSLLAHLARARVKCSRACARTISTGNVSYVLKMTTYYVDDDVADDDGDGDDGDDDDGDGDDDSDDASDSKDIFQIVSVPSVWGGYP